MKKVLLLLPFVALMAACSKHNDAKPALTPQTATAADIEGKWQLVSDTTFQTQNGQTTITVNNVNNITGYFVYNSDGTGAGLTGTQVSSTFTYSVSGGVIKQQVTTTGSTGAPTEADFDILVITSNKLIIRFTSSNSQYQDAALTR